MAVIVSNDSVTKVVIIFQLRFIGILDFLLFCTTKGNNSKKSLKCKANISGFYNKYKEFEVYLFLDTQQLNSEDEG